VSAAVISTLIFASPGASAFSGSRTDSGQPMKATGDGRGGVTLAQVTARARATVDPSADYWHALAVKRLKIIGKRERRIVALLVRIHKLRAGGRKRVDGIASRSGSAASPASIICSVFGSHCSEAISVATCESHLNVHAVNAGNDGRAGTADDYDGLFQFGSFARAHYGFAWDALTQARAAYRYWRDAGWSPWQCRPT